VHVAKKINDVLGTGEQRDIPLDDDAVETVVYKSQQAAKQLGKGFHRSSWMLLLDNKIIGQRTGGNPAMDMA
jgi:hypothetical protein